MKRSLHFKNPKTCSKGFVIALARDYNVFKLWLHENKTLQLPGRTKRPLGINRQNRIPVPVLLAHLSLGSRTQISICSNHREASFGNTIQPENV